MERIGDRDNQGRQPKVELIHNRDYVQQRVMVERARAEGLWLLHTEQTPGPPHLCGKGIHFVFTWPSARLWDTLWGRGNLQREVLDFLLSV